MNRLYELPLAQLGSCCDDSTVSVNDAVCMFIDLEDTSGGDPITIWENDVDGFVINGTIMVENKGLVATAPVASLLVNGVAVTGFDVAPGEARAITMEDIDSISINGAGVGTSKVKVSFSINYTY